MNPLKRHQKARLLRVCKVIREKLGLSGLGVEYEFDDDDGHSYASSYMFYSGWRLRITLYNRFFNESLEHQLETLVHEHLHGAMMPYDQAVMRAEKKLPQAHRHAQNEALHVAREITVEHLAAPLAKLLWPELRRALA